MRQGGSSQRGESQYFDNSRGIGAPNLIFEGRGGGNAETISTPLMISEWSGVNIHTSTLGTQKNRIGKRLNFVSSFFTIINHGYVRPIHLALFQFKNVTHYQAFC